MLLYLVILLLVQLDLALILKRGASFLNPQIGIVYIDNNSRIGSGCTIDRAKIDTTYIGRNCMIDNLVHIAHNVHISESACIAAQTGISGSVFIDKNVTIGGQVGIAGHLNIGKNVIIAAKSGVTKNINENSAVAGFPALDIKLWKKILLDEKKWTLIKFKKCFLTDIHFY